MKVGRKLKKFFKNKLGKNLLNNKKRFCGIIAILLLCCLAINQHTVLSIADEEDVQETVSEVQEKSDVESKNKQAEKSTTSSDKNSTTESTVEETSDVADKASDIKLDSSKALRADADTAAAKIVIKNTGIVLKNDGEFLLIDSPESYVDGTYDPDDDVKEKGFYDSNTILEFANEGSGMSNELYSEPKSGGANIVQQITTAQDTKCQLTIISDSKLNVLTSSNYGIQVNQLTIGDYQELVWQQVVLNVQADKIGILTNEGTRNITGKVNTTGTQAGISITKETPPERENYSEMESFFEKLEQEDSFGRYEAEPGTQMSATATSNNGTASVFEEYSIRGSTFIAEASGKGYGIFARRGISLESCSGSINDQEDSFLGSLSGKSSSGIAIFSTESIENMGGKISGTSNSSNAIEFAIYSGNVGYGKANVTFASEMTGTTSSGFGILARMVFDENGQTMMDPGSIDISSGKISGHSDDGVGILSGSITTENTVDVEVNGKALKGQGIIADNLTSRTPESDKPTVSVSGISEGASNSYNAKVLEIFNLSRPDLNQIPSSAGIVSVTGISGEGNNFNLSGLAPKSIDKSYGIYTPESSEAGISITADNHISVSAVGDYGMKISELILMVSNPLDDVSNFVDVFVDARSSGILASRTIRVESQSEGIASPNSKINVLASEGDGITAESGINISIQKDPGKDWKLPVTINAAKTAISLLVPADGYGEGFNFHGIDLEIPSGQVGIKGINSGYANFNYSNFIIETSDEGIHLGTSEDSEPTYLDINGTSIKIVSGEYGLKVVNGYISLNAGDSKGDRIIDVTANKFPIWLEGSTELQNYEKYDEVLEEGYYDQFSIITTSKQLQPDKSSYPAFYVKDHEINISGDGEQIQIIENYLAPVTTPFNATASTPYLFSKNYNIEKYSNYAWEALRTDTNAPITLSLDKISQNLLSTLDEAFTEATLTGKREDHVDSERIFNDSSGVQNPEKILHEVNMIVRREQQYRVHYEGNGADGGNVPIDNNLYSKTDMVNVEEQGNLTKTDHQFVGWLNSVDGMIYQNPNISTSPTTYSMGEEDVTFTAQWQSTSIVEELKLDGNIPDNLKFGTHTIQYDSAERYYATDSGNDTENNSASDLTKANLTVTDTRISTEGWRLSAKQLEQFKTSSNKNLTNAQLSLTVGQRDVSQVTSGLPTGVENQEVILVPGVSSPLMSASGGTGKGIVVLPIEKFTLTIPAASEKYSEEYSTQVEWLLSNVP